MRHLIDICDLSKEEIEELLSSAQDIAVHPSYYNESCKEKILATLFFEPSTRTRLSFETAIQRLGGSVISCDDPATSSASKGESLSDTIRVIDNYADIIAIRHPFAGAALLAAQNAHIPIINAGDGEHCHPTQTLGDLFTIQQEKGSLNGLNIGLCGDLLYGRTVHSLINAFSYYENTTFTLIAPQELQLPKPIIEAYAGHPSINFVFAQSLEDALPKLDVLYMTRIQRERFSVEAIYNALFGYYVLDANKMKLAKKDCIVLHPLPRLNEIAYDFDDDPRACYFKQVKNACLMRQALILYLLKHRHDRPITPTLEKAAPHDKKCINPHCIISKDPSAKTLGMINSKGHPICAYCEHILS